MRLLTHNLLSCHARTCVQTSNNFPLAFKDVQLELIEAEYNEAFLRGFIPKIHWPALVAAARQVRRHL
jgi:multifunctional methyltransferase subunit TRM112